MKWRNGTDFLVDVARNRRRAVGHESAGTRVGDRARATLQNSCNFWMARWRSRYLQPTVERSRLVLAAAISFEFSEHGDLRRAGYIELAGINPEGPASGTVQIV